MLKSIALALFLVGALAALPAASESHATDEVAQFLSNPKLTPQQQSLLREIAQDPSLDGKIASLPMRLANQAKDTQACLAAQYILFQDIARSKPSSKVLQFARENLTRKDWCSPVVSALTNGQSISQVLARPDAWR